MCPWFQPLDSVQCPGPSPGSDRPRAVGPGLALQPASFPSMPLESPCRSEARRVLLHRSALAASTDVTLGLPPWPGNVGMLSPQRPDSPVSIHPLVCLPQQPERSDGSPRCPQGPGRHLASNDCHKLSVE